MNSDPAPGRDDTVMAPPSSRASSRLIDRPRPVPPYLRLVVPSACWNASKIMASLSGAMPIPVSRTVKATIGRGSSGRPVAPRGPGP